MARAERGVFSYPEYIPFKTLNLRPRHTTEKQFKNILKRCVGTHSTVLIQIETSSIFIPPKGFMQAQALSPENQEKFIDITARIAKEGEKVTVQIPTFKFSKN